MGFYDHQQTHKGENISLAYATFGEPVTATGRPNSNGDNIQLVTQPILQAPGTYKSPAEREAEADKKHKMELHMQKMRAAKIAKAKARAEAKEQQNAAVAEAWREGDESKVEDAREEFWDQIQ